MTGLPSPFFDSEHAAQYLLRPPVCTPVLISEEEKASSPATRLQRLDLSCSLHSRAFGAEHPLLGDDLNLAWMSRSSGPPSPNIYRAATAPSLGEKEPAAAADWMASLLQRQRSGPEDLDPGSEFKWDVVPSFMQEELTAAGSATDDMDLHPVKQGSTQDSDRVDNNMDPAPPTRKVSRVSASENSSPQQARQLQHSPSAPALAGGKKLNSRKSRRPTVEQHRAAVKHLEQQLEVSENEKIACQERITALSERVIQLQAERSRLHLREMKIAELADSLSAVKVEEDPRRPDVALKLESILMDLTQLQNDSAHHAPDCITAKVLSYINPLDFEATSPATMADLMSHPLPIAIQVRPSELVVALQVGGRDRQEGAVTMSMADLMQITEQSFFSLIATTTRVLAEVCSNFSIRDAVRDPWALKIICGLRALICCLNAIHPASAPLQQLRHLESWEIIDDETNDRLLRALMVSLSLTPAQLASLRQAALSFKRQQTQIQAERRHLLYAAQRAIYSTSSLSSTETARIMSAALRLRQNQEEDVDNVCRMTTHFLTRVLTTEQLLELTIAAYPYSLNVMGMVQMLVNNSGPSRAHAVSHF